MRLGRWVFAVSVLALGARGALAQAAPQGAASSAQDTLPERVAMRTFETWKRHEIDANYANYDSVFTYLRFGDPVGEHKVYRDAQLKHLKADTAVMRIVNGQKVELVRSDVYGAFVVQEWTETFADGRSFKHFEMFEVRGGKIVREIEGDILLNPKR